MSTIEDLSKKLDKFMNISEDNITALRQDISHVKTDLSTKVNAIEEKLKLSSNRANQSPNSLDQPALDPNSSSASAAVEDAESNFSIVKESDS